MEQRSLDGVDAFVVVDLEGTDRAVGIVRAARKVLRDGAELLARSQTYAFAALELPAGGASVGINVGGGDRDEVVAAAVAALVPEVAEGRVLLEAGKGLADEDLAPLRAVDPRPAAWWDLRRTLAGRSAAGAAGAVLGGWEGRTLALEQADPVSVAFAAAAVGEGARLVAVGLDGGTVALADGTDPAALLADGDGVDLAGLGVVDADRPVATADVDALAVGSKAGVVDHEVAADLAARTLVPTGPVPVTARGLAVARRRGCTVLPDFVTLSGPIQALLADADEVGAEALEARAAADAGALVAEVRDHDEGPLLGACERAEAFLGTWRDELPFGRPLA